MSHQTASSIEDRAAFDRVRYANCWEDADILCRALDPQPGKRMLSIASGGDNAFALALSGAEVLAADLSPAQLALCRLKQAAIQELTHAELLAFLGLAQAGAAERRKVLAALEGRLPEADRAFWEANQESIECGVAHMGKFENYFRVFRTKVLPLVHTKRRIAGLLEQRDQAGREAFYISTWDNLRWRLLFRLFFSRRVMGSLGRDPEFFRYVEGSVAERILTRAKHALTVLPTHDNPYLRFILTGSFGDVLPRYLRPGTYADLKEAMARVAFLEGPIQEAAKAWGGPVHGFNLSDIFEYLDPDLCRAIYEQLLSVAAPCARLAYWNMLAPRSRPESLARRVRELADLAQSLHHQDKAFFYAAFRVEEVVR